MTSVQLVEAGQTTTLPTIGGPFIIVPGGTKVLRMYSRQAECNKGTVQITLELQSSPPRTHMYTAALTSTRTSVELGDVKRFF